MIRNKPALLFVIEASAIPEDRRLSMIESLVQSGALVSETRSLQLALEDRFFAALPLLIDKATPSDVSETVFAAASADLTRDYNFGKRDYSAQFGALAESFAHNCGIDSEDPSGNTPLMIAVAHKNLEMVGPLLSHGADPDYKGSSGGSACSRALLLKDTIEEQRLMTGPPQQQVTTTPNTTTFSTTRVLSMETISRPDPRVARIRELLALHCREGCARDGNPTPPAHK